MKLFPWTVFFPEGFENGSFKGFRPATIWRGAAFHFLPVFSKKKNLWKLIVIFENVSPTGFFWPNMKIFEISVLTANSRYLQTAALNFREKIEKTEKSWAVGHLEKCLSLDKIAILKSLVVSQIVYLLSSSLPNPQGVIEEVNSLLYDFLWHQKWQN